MPNLVCLGRSTVLYLLTRRRGANAAHTQTLHECVFESLREIVRTKTSLSFCNFQSRPLSVLALLFSARPRLAQVLRWHTSAASPRPAALCSRHIYLIDPMDGFESADPLPSYSPQRLGCGCGRRLVTGSCVIRETTQTGRPWSRPRVSLSIYLSIYRPR